MIDLDSPRWSELKHAGCMIDHVPDLIRAIAAEEIPEHAENVREARENPRPWDYVYQVLCHQYSIYPVTYAAFPHIVNIAEANGIAKRVETLYLAGAIHVHNYPYPGMPADLAADFQTALARVRRWSLETIRGMAVDESEPRGLYLAGLLQAFGGLRYPHCVYVRRIGMFEDGNCEVEVDLCLSCRRDIRVRMDDTGLLAMATDDRGWQIEGSATRTIPDRSKYGEQIARGNAILTRSEDPPWEESETAAVLAALAVERDAHTLATHILDLAAVVECPHCRCKFPLADGLENAWWLLPQTGPVPFVPPKGASFPKRTSRGAGGSYIDDSGNDWQGPYQPPGGIRDPEKLFWYVHHRDGSHTNVGLNGEIAPV